MFFREQPAFLEQLPPDLQAAAEAEAQNIYAKRIHIGTICRIVMFVNIFAVTDYLHDLPVLTWCLCASLALVFALRTWVVIKKDEISQRSLDLWYAMAGCGSVGGNAVMGFLLAYTMFHYGFSSKNYLVILLFHIGELSGSLVAPRSVFRLQNVFSLGPPVIVSLWLHNLLGLEFVFGALLFFAFLFVHNNQMHEVFWKQIQDRFLEDQRARELDEARRKAELGIKSRSEFLANMSHEIRTPMNAILGMSALVLDQTLPAETLDYVQTIRSSSESLLTIINDILDFSKIESGKLDLERAPLSLRECVEDVLELLANRAQSQKIELAADLQLDANDDWIYGDITRLRQILLNLTGNAIKFTHEGEVVVSVSRQLSKQGTPTLCFAVRDTGIGIAPENIGKLFQSFSQADASTTRRFGGTGLGLAISKRLTELMGGRIWVTSELGRGSVFQFEIPFVSAPAQPQPWNTRPEWQGVPILLMLSHLATASSLSRLLAYWGFLPQTAHSVQEALDLIRAHCFRAAFVDEGSLATALDEERLALPVVLLSASPAITEDFSAVLPKPVRLRQLHRVLSRVVSGIAAEEPARLASQFDPDFVAVHPLTILLAEDNPVNQKLAMRLLEKLGYRADAVSNGLLVLAALERQNYDLVLMDVQMPEMDGLEATRQIHARWPNKRPWITALTAGVMKENRAECAAAGVDDYLAKPINVEELKQSLARCRTERKRPDPMTSDLTTLAKSLDRGKGERLHFTK